MPSEMFTDLYAMAMTSSFVSIHEYIWAHQYITLLIDYITLQQSDFLKFTFSVECSVTVRSSPDVVIQKLSHQVDMTNTNEWWRKHWFHVVFKQKEVILITPSLNRFLLHLFIYVTINKETEN